MTSRLVQGTGDSASQKGSPTDLNQGGGFDSSAGLLIFLLTFLVEVRVRE